MEGNTMGLLSALNQFNPFAKGTMADQVGDKYERYKVIIETFAPLLSGRIGENTPETTKAALRGSTRVPEDHELMDEKVYMRILVQLSEDDRNWILSFTEVEYPTGHSHPWMREAAKDGLDQWRRWIMFLVDDPVMGTRTKNTKHNTKGKVIESETEPYEVKPGDDKPAVKYLELIVKDLKEALEYVAKKRKLTNTTIATMTKRQIDACKEEAYGRVTLNMQQLGQTWMPSPDDKPFATKAIDFAQKMIQKKGLTGQQLLTAALARSKSFIGFALQKVKWLDELLARHAATLRKDRESYLTWWGAFKHNQQIGMPFRSALTNAPKVARASRFGRWESWSYRLSYAIMKRVLPF
jgi:hypothetical protein